MLLIDTYNVLHMQGILPGHLAGLDLSGLASLIATSRYASRPVQLICDGAGGALGEGLGGGWGSEARAFARSSGLIRAVYAGPGADADSLIEQILDESSAPRRILVVSSDRRVRRAAKRRRAMSVTAEMFLTQILADRDKPRPKPFPEFTRQIPLDRYSVAHWMETFGYGQPEDLAKMAGTRPQAPRAKEPSAAPSCEPPDVEKKLDVPVSGLPCGEQIDPLLLDALEEWAGRLTLDDLDMRKWLKD